MEISYQSNILDVNAKEAISNVTITQYNNLFIYLLRRLLQYKNNVYVLQNYLIM